MPDPLLILEACALAAVLAASGRWLGGALGVVLGVVGAGWWLGLTPRFPPGEDLDRWMIVVLPALIVAELIAVRSRTLGWIARLAVAAAATPILLFGSVFVTDLAGPNSREWTPALTTAIFVGLGATLAATWFALARLTARAPGRTVLFTLAIAAFAAGATILLSGYLGAGQLGLALAAALFAATVVAPSASVVGVGVVGLFSLLVVGRFFGNLTTTNAALLFAAPLLGWLPELARGRVGPRVRGIARLGLTVAPAALAIFLALRTFNAGASAAKPGEASAADYLNFGK